MDDGGDIIEALSSDVGGVRERRSEDGEEVQDESEEETSSDIVCRKGLPARSGDKDWHAEVVPVFEHK